MKRINESAQVITENRRPKIVIWGKRRFTVTRVVDFWIRQSRWWGKEEKRVYLLLNTDHGLIEVYRRDETWILSRLFD